METLGFCSKSDWRSIEAMEDIFLPKKNIVWFLKQEETGKWLAEDSDHVCDKDHPAPLNFTNKHIVHNGVVLKCLYSEVQLTDDPLKAKKFETEVQALTYCIKNELGRGWDTVRRNIDSLPELT